MQQMIPFNRKYKMAVSEAKTNFNIDEKLSLESQIGNTPLVRLSRIAKDLPECIEIYAKAEHLNPGGSVKDRAALAMILAGERDGKLTKDKTILDATSGNTGIAYAMIGAARGYSVTLCLPKNASFERKRILKLYGAEIIETDPLSGTDGAQTVAKELAAKSPQKYFYSDQYNNEANWLAHYDGSAPEIWQQTGGRITHFLAGLGTTGTFVGTTRKLKELNPKIQAISMQPDSPLHGLEGMKHLETAIVPGIYDADLADETVEVATEDAQTMTRRLALEEGLFVGVSSGANVFAALRLARQLKSQAVIVTILCDGGGKYLSESFWDTE
ncbi:MAG: cysteine synthase family protein [Acidobacteriota bacterium]|nr:cysteine synthase family protein [Acidobacteriota bacterium]